MRAEKSWVASTARVSGAAPTTGCSCVQPSTLTHCLRLAHCYHIYTGYRSSMPVMVAPMAMHGLAHADKETGTAKAAAAAGVPMVRAPETALVN